MTRIRSLLALSAFALGALVSPLVSAQTTSAHPPLLLRSPSLSQDKIAFRYADDIWTVSRQGGDAERLTSNGQVVAGPFFSPDGASIAYSAHLQGNTDVYIVPAAGGVPRRITWHPAGSAVVGWSRDGKDVLIASGEASYRHFSAPLPRPRRRLRHARAPPPARRRPGFFLARRRIHRLPAHHQVGAGLEALRRWPNHPHLDRQPQNPRPGQSPPRKLQRLRSRLGRQLTSTSSPIAAKTAPDWSPSSATTQPPKKSPRPRPTPASTSNPSRQAPAVSSMSSSAPSTCSTPPQAKTKLSPSRSTANCPTSRPTSPPSRRMRFKTPTSRPPAPAPSLRPTAKSSPSPPRKATPATSPNPRSGRARSRLEPRRQNHRLLLRRLRRVPALPPRPDRIQAARGHRPRPRPQLLLRPHLVARLQTHRLRRQAPAHLVHRRPDAGRTRQACPRATQAHPHRQRHLRQLRRQLQLRMVARLQVDRLPARPRQPVERHLPLLARNPQIHPGHRWHERCHQPRLRPQRQVPLLPRVHQRRPLPRRYRPLFPRPRPDLRPLRRRPVQGRRFARPA